MANIEFARLCKSPEGCLTLIQILKTDNIFFTSMNNRFVEIQQMTPLRKLDEARMKLKSPNAHNARILEWFLLKEYSLKPPTDELGGFFVPDEPKKMIQLDSDLLPTPSTVFGVVWIPTHKGGKGADFGVLWKNGNKYILLVGQIKLGASTICIGKTETKGHDQDYLCKMYQKLNECGLIYKTKFIEKLNISDDKIDLILAFITTRKLSNNAKTYQDYPVVLLDNEWIKSHIWSTTNTFLSQ